MATSTKHADNDQTHHSKAVLKKAAAGVLPKTASGTVVFGSANALDRLHNGGFSHATPHPNAL